MIRIVVLRNLFRNLGDEAMLASEVSSLRACFPSASLTLLVDEPSRVSPTAGVVTAFSDIALMRPRAGADLPPTVRRAIPRVSVSLWRRLMTGAFEHSVLPSGVVPDGIRDLRRHLAEADVVIAGGGLMPSRRTLYETREAVFRLLNRLGKPLILSGQSLYPFGERAAPYRLASRIVLRDDCFSREQAIGAGLDPSQIIDGVDPAFAMAAATDDAAGAALAALGISPGERFIAVSVRSGSPSSEVIAEALRSAVSQKLADCLLLFGMQRYWRDCDDDVVRDVERRLSPLRVRVAPEWSAPLLKAVVARAQAAIACRYHAAVFALTSGTPAVSIAVQPEYEWKLRGIYDQFEHAEWLTRPQNLASTLLDVLRRRELFSTELREKERLLRPRVARLTDAVADVLRGRRFAA